MNPQNPELLLAKFYKEQASEYERILGLMESVNESMKAGEAHDNSMSEIHELVQVVQERDQAVSATRNAWIAGGQRPGAELAQVLKQVEGLILQLLESVSETEKFAYDAKTKLLPKLSEEVTARKMHSAYAAASTLTNE